MIGLISLVGAIGPSLYWSGVLLLALGSLVCSAIALRVFRRELIIVSAAALACAIVMVVHPVGRPLSGYSILLTLVALALAVVGGGPAAKLVLAMATRGSVAEGSYGGIVLRSQPDDSTGTPTREVLRGGATIGFLERFALAAAIVAGFPEAIAVLAAVKGVGRFSELDRAESRERFIIGTLVSLIWASACAGLAYFTLHQPSG